MSLGREVAGRGLPEGSPDPSEASLSNPDLRWFPRAFTGSRFWSRFWVKKGCQKRPWRGQVGTEMGPRKARRSIRATKEAMCEKHEKKTHAF